MKNRYDSEKPAPIHISLRKDPLSDFFRITGLDEDEYAQYVGEADTLAGFLLELKGDFPRKDEELVCKDLVMKVMEKKERRISGIRVNIKRG